MPQRRPSCQPAGTVKHRNSEVCSVSASPHLASPGLYDLPHLAQVLYALSDFPALSGGQHSSLQLSLPGTLETLQPCEMFLPVLLHDVLVLTPRSIRTALSKVLSQASGTSLDTLSPLASTWSPPALASPPGVSSGLPAEGQGPAAQPLLLTFPGSDLHLLWNSFVLPSLCLAGHMLFSCPFLILALMRTSCPLPS